MERKLNKTLVAAALGAIPLTLYDYTKLSRKEKDTDTTPDGSFLKGKSPSAVPRTWLVPIAPPSSVSADPEGESSEDLPIGQCLQMPFSVLHEQIGQSVEPNYDEIIANSSISDKEAAKQKLKEQYSNYVNVDKVDSIPTIRRSMRRYILKSFFCITLILTLCGCINSADSSPLGFTNEGIETQAWKTVEWSQAFQETPEKPVAENSPPYLKLTVQIPADWSVVREEWALRFFTDATKIVEFTIGSVRLVENPDEPFALIEQRYGYNSMDRHGSFNLENFAVMYDVMYADYAYYLSNGEFLIRCATVGDGMDDFKIHAEMSRIMQTITGEKTFEALDPREYECDVIPSTIPSDPFLYDVKHPAYFEKTNSSFVPIQAEQLKAILQLEDGILTLIAKDKGKEALSLKQATQEQISYSFAPYFYGKVFSNIGWYDLDGQYLFLLLKADSELANFIPSSRIVPSTVGVPSIVDNWVAYQIDLNLQSVVAVQILPDIKEMISCEREGNLWRIIGKNKAGEITQHQFFKQ